MQQQKDGCRIIVHDCRGLGSRQFTEQLFNQFIAIPTLALSEVVL